MNRNYRYLIILFIFISVTFCNSFCYAIRSIAYGEIREIHTYGDPRIPENIRPELEISLVDSNTNKVKNTLRLINKSLESIQIVGINFDQEDGTIIKSHGLVLPKEIQPGEAIDINTILVLSIITNEERIVKYITIYYKNSKTKVTFSSHIEIVIKFNQDDAKIIPDLLEFEVNQNPFDEPKDYVISLFDLSKFNIIPFDLSEFDVKNTLDQSKVDSWLKNNKLTTASIAALSVTSLYSYSKLHKEKKLLVEDLQQQETKLQQLEKNMNQKNGYNAEEIKLMQKMIEDSKQKIDELCVAIQLKPIKCQKYKEKIDAIKVQAQELQPKTTEIIQEAMQEVAAIKLSLLMGTDPLKIIYMTMHCIDNSYNEIRAFDKAIDKINELSCEDNDPGMGSNNNSGGKKPKKIKKSEAPNDQLIESWQVPIHADSFTNFDLKVTLIGTIKNQVNHIKNDSFEFSGQNFDTNSDVW